MKYSCVWLLLMLMHTFSACDRIGDPLIASDEVKLTATLSPTLSTTYTKGDGEIKSSYQNDLNIGISKVLGEEGNFDSAENEALQAVMHAPTQQSMGLREIKFGVGDFQGFPDASTKLNYVSWYPQSGNYENPAEGNTTVTFDIPREADTDILYSDVTSGTRITGFRPMTFHHALVKYTIKVYAMESEDHPGSASDAWGKINSVTFENMPAVCRLSLPVSSETLPAVSFSGEADLVRETPSFDKIPTGFSNAVELTYFLAPPPSEENNTLNIKVVTEKSPDGKNVKTSIARDFQSGKHYQIYLRFTTHGIINAEIMSGDWNDSNDSLHVDTNTGVYYDLSESQTANTYVISSAYNYCFDASVRGNGYTGIAGIPGAPSDIYKVADPVSAEIVWTDLVASSDENLDNYFKLSPAVVDGRVFFSVIPKDGKGNSLKKEGNIVIGVRDSKGDMLWTWHIWLTDRPAEQSYKNGFNVQDRDLGATAYNAEKEPSGINGLYYQWGRPTPLPLGKTVYKPDYDANGTWIKNTVVELGESNENVTVINRIKSPMTFFNQKATASDGTITKSLWGWRNETDEYAKTIYDPCPPGYRVPSIKLWRDLVIYDANDDGMHDATVVGTQAVKFQVDINHVDVYYPMTGYYTTLNNHVDNNKGAYMWAATYYVGELNDASDDQPYALDFALDAGGDVKEMETKPEYSNYAMPVRCISRMSKAHVTNLSDYQTANSYIVSKNGYYKFKATVRGNGIGQLVSPGANSTIVLTEQLQSVNIKNQLVKVEPLWWHSTTTVDEAVLNAGKHFSMLNKGVPDADGYVTFNVDTFYEGNLILAGYDAKGEIIWSWHIWFTDEPDMMKSNAFVVMDRNLGATHAPTGTVAPTGTDLSETYGLYYQWGRKDPFLPLDSSVYKFSDGTYNSESDAFSAQDAATEKTVENSVKYPMTFNLASEWDTNIADELVYQDNYNTLYTSQDLASCNISKYQCFSNMLYPDSRKSLWGYSALSNTYGVTTTKTMYDPCPPGYVVAYYLVWTNTERNINYNLYYTKLDGGFQTHGLTADQYGIFLTKDYDDRFDPAWYPYAGYMSGENGDLIGNQPDGVGIFHTSTPAGNSSRSIAYNKYWSGQSIEGSSYGLPSSFAYPVRCQKE